MKVVYNSHALATEHEMFKNTHINKAHDLIHKQSEREKKTCSVYGFI